MQCSGWHHLSATPAAQYTPTLQPAFPLSQPHNKPPRYYHCSHSGPGQQAVDWILLYNHVILRQVQVSNISILIPSFHSIFEVNIHSGTMGCMRLFHVMQCRSPAIAFCYTDRILSHYVYWGLAIRLLNIHQQHCKSSGAAEIRIGRIQINIALIDQSRAYTEIDYVKPYIYLHRIGLMYKSPHADIIISISFMVRNENLLIMRSDVKYHAHYADRNRNLAITKLAWYTVMISLSIDSYWFYQLRLDEQ